MYNMTEYVPLEKLPDDLKHLITAKLIPYDLNNLRATNKSNRTLQKSLCIIHQTMKNS